MSSHIERDDRTACVHHPQPNLDGFASFAVPVYRASTIVFPDARSYRERAARSPDGYSYGLTGTPTSRTLEAQLSGLHRGERSIIVPSGQAATAALMLTVLQAGDHVLIPDNVYPPVKQFAAEVLRPFGVAVGIYDPLDLDALDKAVIAGATRLIWIESPGSTTMEVADIATIAALARSKGILTGCDNTWASPLLCKPLELGVDVVAEALTKYVGGHSDLLLGSLTFRDVDLYARVRRHLGTLGIGVSPDDCALALRGIETLALRLDHVGRVAAEFAGKLGGLSGIAEVLHPALPSASGHDVWKRDFRGASGVFTVRLKPCSQAVLDRALGQLEVFAMGASWGGTRSLVAPMTLGSDRTCRAVDPDHVYLRISIGLESPEALWADLERFAMELS